MNELKDTVLIVEDDGNNKFVIHTIFEKLPVEVEKQIVKINGVRHGLSFIPYQLNVMVAQCFDTDKVIDQVKKCILKYNYERCRK